MQKVTVICLFACCLLTVGFQKTVQAQGVTTAAISGIVLDGEGNPLPGANILAVHEPSGTKYGTASRIGGTYNIPNMRVGGPYTVTVSFVGFQTNTESNVFLNLAQNLQLSFQLSDEVLQGDEIVVSAEADDVMNADRTGAETTISVEQIQLMPSLKRSTRDLTRLDPRSDGNLSFGGRNWLYNNISLDGSYFNNPFGLDAPEPGGQSNAQPVPYDAIEQVQVSVAPFDVREGGFTGAGINQVTKSGTNEFKGSVYTFNRNETMVGNQVDKKDVFANPRLSFAQYGASFGGPIIKNKLFFFINGEIERREDPGTNYRANDGSRGVGESRPSAITMQAIRDRMKSAYGYETGAFDAYTHDTNNEKLLAKLNWNINDNHTMSLRYNYMDAFREQGPHPFVLSFNGTGRGPNATSLPFENSGYRINNNLHSVAFEVNSRSTSWANRFFASYNRFRDYRLPFSTNFPTIELGEGGATYTTIGHEPFSIHNILDQDVLQVTNNFSYFRNRHVYTVGVNVETFRFFNSFNIFRHGLFGLPFAETTLFSLDQFFDVTDRSSPNFIDMNALVGSGPFKGEEIDLGQVSFYAQDEFLVSDKLNLTYGLRVDIPMYFTDPVANPYSTGLTLLDENDNPETIDQAKLAGASPLFSPRIGFNYDVRGDRTLQFRGGLGVFTGRIPFVWVGNVISNPGFNPNLYPSVTEQVVTREGESSDPTSATGGQEANSILQTSFDLNAMTDDFKWPQVFTLDLAVDTELPNGILGTLEVVYSKDLNSIYVRNADLVAPVSTLNDGRPFYGGFGVSELNDQFFGNGVFVIDNENKGYNYSVTGQLRKQFDSGLNGSLSYTFMEAKNLFKSTEIASVLFSESPVQGDPNRPSLSHSEFGNRHRIVAGATYTHKWNANNATHFGFFVEVAEGNTFVGGGGNRYSYTYSGDVNGDGFGGNDLIYIPQNPSEIRFTTPAQSDAFFEFLNQDDYLKANKGKIAERFGALNPWYSNVDMRVMHDVAFNVSGKQQKVQISLDILNVGNFINSEWGIRKVADPRATSPLILSHFDATGEPVFNFSGVRKTFVNDLGLLSRYQMQLGIRYIFN